MEKNLLFVQKLDTQKIKPGKGLLAFAILWFFCFSAMAQNITITGKVTDAKDGLTIPGASVLVKATTIGTITDIDGIYNLAVPADAILVFSFVGYESVEIAVNGRTKIDCQLSEVTRDIDEVIVIGYGTQKKSDKTGAVAMITAAELNQGVLQDPIQGLQSKAAGVMISKKGGDPNSGFSVKIRGATSIMTGTQPLYVVDGVPGVDPTTISSEDIESFNVLKDASSAAIYGSRGANGVIIITTKRGLGGKGKQSNQIEVSSYLSTDIVAKRLDLLSSSQVRKYVADNNLSFIDGGGDTDWQDEIYRTGSTRNVSVGFSGGDENGSFRASASHNEYNGVVIGTSKTRTIGRINVDKKAFDDHLTIQSGLSGTFEHNEYISYGGWGSNDILFQAFQRNPTDPVRDSTGKLYDTQRGFNYWNPVKLVDDIQNERDAKRFYGFFKADLEIFKGFSAGINIAYTRDDNEGFYFEPSTMRLGTAAGFGKRNYDNTESKIFETTLRYKNSFDVHNLELVGGYSFQEDFSTGLFAQGSQPFLNNLGAYNISLLQNVVPGTDIGSSKSSSRLISFFGRGVYNFNSKYYLTATIRRDGSSKFGKNNEWGVFPSASLMWNIKSEQFMEPVEIISNLKLRLSYGMAGNQEIGRYLDEQYYISSGTAPNPETGEQVTIFKFAHNANPDLKWEENTEINIGADFGILDDKISGSMEFFKKNITDLLGAYSVPVPPNAVDRIYANVGEVEIKGIEIFVQAYPVRIKNFEWKTSMAYTSYSQEVVSLSNSKYEWSQLKEGYLSGPGLVGDLNWTQVLKPGYPVGTWYMPEYAGLSADGQFLFYTDAGGVTRDITLAERRNMGDAQPDFELGWSNYFTIYNNFDCSFNIRTVYGYKIYNTTNMIFGNAIWLPNGNVLQSALEEKDRGLKDNPTISSYYLEDGSFVRLDNLSFGYNFKNIPSVKNIRLYFTANNLFTITNYTGIDPEISPEGISFGLDQYNVYPKSRSFTFGINVTL